MPAPGSVMTSCGGSENIALGVLIWDGRLRLSPIATPPLERAMSTRDFLSDDLETRLGVVYQAAKAARHLFLTVDHLLLAILGAPRVTEILSAQSCDVGELEQQLHRYMDVEVPRSKEGEKHELQPTIGFRRVMERAVYNAQLSLKGRAGVEDVLVAIYEEKEFPDPRDAHAVKLLERLSKRSQG